MAVPLIAMAIAGGVRMVMPKVAQYLAKQGFKKASTTAVKKAPSAPKMNMTQARKVAQGKNVPKRPTLANRNYQRKPDGSIKLSNGKPILKKPTPKTEVAKSPGSAVATQGSRAVAKRPGSAVAKRTSASSDKGKIVGLSNKAKAALAGTAVGAATLAGSVSSNKKKQKSPRSGMGEALTSLPSISKPQTTTPVPLKPTPPKRPVQGPKDKPLKPLEGGVRYINNPFGKGKIKVDSSDEGMAFEEYGEKKGGRLNKTVRRRMGGKVRGYGKAMRGY